MHEEALWLERARQGEEGAFDRLVAPLLPRAYRTAALIARDPDLAADALQEALLRAYRSLGNVRPGAAFAPWFLRIVVREALKQAQARSRRAMSPLPVALADGGGPGGGPGARGWAAMDGPEGAVLAREERERLWRAIQALSPAHRAVIVLRYYEELSEAEMAALLGVSPGTVKSRLHHARRALERRLTREAPPGGPLVRLTRLLHGGVGDD